MTDSDPLAPEAAAVDDDAVFRLAYVPGVMPAKWARGWRERRSDVALELVECSAAEAAALISDGSVDAALLRPAVVGSEGVDPLIRLYDETTVVVVPKDHVFTAVDDVPAAELAGEQLLVPLDDVLGWDQAPGSRVEHRPETVPDAMELVAAGIGVLLVPQSLARLHHRRDLTYRPVPDAPSSTVGLTWREPISELVEELIGIVRGRKAGSSRGEPPAPKRSAKQKAADRKARLEAAGKIPVRKSSGKGGARRGKGRGGR